MEDNLTFLTELADYKTIILANGEIPQTEIALQFLQKADYIVCCDGAVENLIKLSLQPDVIVGDCDSISKEYYKKFNSIIHPDTDPEYNDLQKSIKFCMAIQKTKIAILGGFGLREDHALANLGILCMYAREIDIIMVTNHGIFTPISQSSVFSSFPGQQVSIFCFDSQNTFTFHHLKYPVINRKFNYLWEGSLNEATGKHFSIDMNGTGIAVVYRTYV
ncbi:MAG: thiamine diphosphokinase [Bacteroidales bacterium]